MGDKTKTKKQLVNELADLRQRMAELEAQEAEHQETDEALSQCRAELKTCYEELDTFARALSRDLRGTLGLIISFAQVLQEYHAALADEELRRYLDIIAQKGHRVLSVIDELLEVETAPPPDKEIDIGPLDMADVVSSALRILAFMIEEQEADVILPESWPVALGYGPWVEEVWFNYLSNALKYGGHPPRVELGATEQADGNVRFWVRDNGSGLTAAKQERLFKPFARPDQIPTVGYGLGLIIVRRIVEQLGGQYGVESEGVLGQGSLFFFTLPAAK